MLCENCQRHLRNGERTYRPQVGIVAILDALGASTYDDDEIKAFLDSRDEVLRRLSDKAERVAQDLDTSRISTYTFNDTILMALPSTNDHVCKSEIKAFTTVLRKLLVDALEHKIMFRGAFAVGKFYEDPLSNTILGQAVTDAAAWYDRAEWIGIVATLRTTIYIEEQMEEEELDWGHLLMKYQVPLVDDSTCSLWAINWPKVFWVKSLTPCRPNQTQRQCFLQLLGAFRIPRNTEDKYFHTLNFFGHVVGKLKLKNQRANGTRQTRSSKR